MVEETPGYIPLACMPSLSHPKRRHQAHNLSLEAGCSSSTGTIPLW
jgi:hypothetical protein